ncbi:glycosyltransferase [Brevundimonas sp. UBA7534]|uniref:glycosyltransferase n=1 Tax=Brevundimonas sp. UBA7534 TaxID=1946138 RepID=UPI0025C740E8|nr:glycosyltransferase [Brevundimonas sp. UBA7534]
MSRSPHVGRALKKSITGIAAQLTGRETPEQLRRYADQARAQQDWARDAFFRRKVCEMEPERLGAWIQYGHALKEAGFHARAAEAYNRALALKPGDPEITLQLGHLAKVRGDFAEAQRCFEEARAGGHPDVDHIDFELKLLRKIDNSRVFWGEGAEGERVPLRVFLSAPAKPVNETDRSAASDGLGRSDYSYAFAMRGFMEALDEMEIDYTLIQRPESIADIRERSAAEINIHLGFYPPEHIRVLKGAYNINCFAWEFDRLRSRDEIPSDHAFADQIQTLSIADEIWSPSEHGATAVRDSGVAKPVRRAPSPVLSNLVKRGRDHAPTPREAERAARDLGAVNWTPLAILPRVKETVEQAAHARTRTLQAILSEFESPTVYVSVLNVHDYRKQAEPMLAGFLRFAETNPDAILMLKLSTPFRGRGLANRILLEDQIANAGRMVPPLVSERIWLTDDVLTRDEMNRFYDAASFYLCTSYAEGQNLPLIEAMARGVVPVSVDHTAMRDYISDNDAVVVPSHRRPLDLRMSQRYRMVGTAMNVVEPGDLKRALETAQGLSPEAYAHKSAAALAEVRDQFGLAPFADRLNAVVERLAAGDRT